MKSRASDVSDATKVMLVAIVMQGNYSDASVAVL